MSDVRLLRRRYLIFHFASRVLADKKYEQYSLDPLLSNDKPLNVQNSFCHEDGIFLSRKSSANLVIHHHLIELIHSISIRSESRVSSALSSVSSTH
jgi:hypothetical protein